MPNGFDVSFNRAGNRGKTTITILYDGTPVHVDAILLTAATAREEFLDALCKAVPAAVASRTEIGAALLAAAAGQAAQVTDTAAADEPENVDKADENATYLAGLPAEAREAAEAMLENPDILAEISADIAAIGVAGEADLALLIYLIGVSRLLRNPLAAILQGSTASGKSYIYGAIAAMFPPHSVVHATQITPNALFYSDPGMLIHKWIVCGERSRKEEDDVADATRALREMISSGKLSKFLPERDEDGKMRSVLVERQGPIAYIESTTLAEVFEEDANRCLLLQTTETEEQTRAILRTQAAARNGHRPATEAILKKHHAAQCMLALGAPDIMLPFAGALAAKFPTERLESRRAIGMVMSCVQSLALLRRRQRQVTEDGRIIATLCDYADARRLLAQPMARGLSGKLQDSVREFYKLLNKQTFADDDYTTADAARKIKVNVRTAQRHLRALAGAGYVRQVEPGRGARPAIWAPEPNAPAEISDLNILPEIFAEEKQ